MIESSAKMLQGREIAITGRLASMSRDEAVHHVLQAGGRYVETPSPETDLLVIGDEGWPLRRDGRLTRSLELARRLQQRGAPITIAPETDFLVALGMEPEQVGLHRLYTTEQLSNILDVPVARVRAWMRAKLITPARIARRLCWFDFREVARVRALQQLHESGVGTNVIRRSLEELDVCLPDANVPLTALEALSSDGPKKRRVLFRRGDGLLSEPNGQLQFNFEGEGRHSEIASTSEYRAEHPTGADADAWFMRGVEAEDEGRLEDASKCYMNALLVGGPQAETTFNLGNVLYGLGREPEAMQRYLQSIELDPEYVEAWNNLGNCLGVLGRHEEALRAYEQALSIEPRIRRRLRQHGREPRAARPRRSSSRILGALSRPRPRQRLGRADSRTPRRGLIASAATIRLKLPLPSRR